MLKTVGNPSTRQGDQTIVDGNLIIGTAGKGIDFSADPHAAGMTSELLDDYEEGTWTPGLTGTGGSAGALAFTSVGNYTKIGRQVFLRFSVNITAAGSYTGKVLITGIPFASSASFVSGNLWLQAVTLASGFLCSPQIGASSFSQIEFPYSTDAGGSWTLQWGTHVTSGIITGTIIYEV